MNKICQKCASIFHCESDSDCWCESVNITQTQMKEIISKFSECICPDCIKQYSDK